MRPRLTLAAIRMAKAEIRLIVNCFQPSSQNACLEVLKPCFTDADRVAEGRVIGIIPPGGCQAV